MKTVSSPWIEALPDPIRASLGPGPFTRCRIGLSGAEVWLSEAQALKIAPVSIESETERTALRWLQGRLPVPALLADARENGKDYLLTSRLDAVPAIDDALLDDPDRLLIFLSGALRALRSVKTDGCPLPDATGAKLRAARENVLRGLCEPDEALLTAYGFPSAASLLDWLERNRPPEEPAFTHGDCCLPNLFWITAAAPGSSTSAVRESPTHIPTSHSVCAACGRTLQAFTAAKSVRPFRSKYFSARWGCGRMKKSCAITPCWTNCCNPVQRRVQSQKTNKKIFRISAGRQTENRLGADFLFAE